MAEKFHDDWEVVPFNLNMEPKEDPDTRALVPANTERQLEAMPLLGILNANRKIHKHTDTDVAFTWEYSRVSISPECTN